MGLLTQADLEILGAGFRRAYPLKQHIDLNEPVDFGALLNAIDIAEANAGGGRHQSRPLGVNDKSETSHANGRNGSEDDIRLDP